MKRVLITSALPYINGIKHLGNLAGSMLPADVYARFQRQRLGGENVLFICATDEHGTPAELAALEERLSVSAYCEKWHAIQKGIAEGFGLSFDYFGRSSSPQNHRLTQDFARALWNAGYLYVKATRQVFSVADGRFLPDRYVVGTCPHCGYERARGDQCENCTRVLDPTDLINPRSAVSGSPDIEIRDSKHLFLRQTAFEPKLRAWIEGKQAQWPHLVTSIALKWLNEGLQDRGITRDLEWGVRVDTTGWKDISAQDREGLAGKVFYVWFDAPIEYIAATWEWADSKGLGEADWQRWWKGAPAADVTYVEFMGKDNVPFHTVGFPCTLFGVNESTARDAPWKLVDKLKGFNWLNYYGGKFSTSQKRGVFMDAALDVLPADYWRWYLIANSPESADSSFTWEHFAATVNKDLADVLGNFVNRVLKFTASRFDSRVPEGGETGPEEDALAAELDERLAAYAGFLDAMEFRKAAAELRGIWAVGNEYLTRAAPWTAIKENRDRAAASVRMAINLVHLFGHASYAIIPTTARTIHETLAPAPEIIGWPDQKMRDFLRQMAVGTEVSVPPVLFAKIDDAQIAAWKARFGGEE